MKFNFRKIASAASSLLLGVSTVALAAAANYPAPFVQNGKADVAIVVGQSAATSDMSAATALSADLGTAFVSQGGSSSTTTSTTTTTGDVFPLFTSSTELYLNDSINTARTSITADDLPSVLADGDFSGNVDADYTQTIDLTNYGRVLFGQEPTTDDDPQVYIRLGTTAANALYNTTITFDRAVNFSHADSQGEILNLFGGEWTVGSDTTSSEIVLYKSSEKFFLTLGGSSPSPSKTVTVDGNSYTIELVSGSDSTATVRVTDSSGHVESKEIDEDQSKKVNGVEVAVTSSDESEALGTITAEVTVGSNKIVLQDGQNVQYGADEDNIEGSTVSFVGGSVGALTQLRVQTYADDSDEDAIVVGGSFLDPVWGTFKVDFTSLTTPLDSTDREMVKVLNSGDDRMRVEFTDHRGNEKSFIFADNESQSIRLAYGNNGREVIRTREFANLNRSMYTVVGNQDEGYLLELKTVTNSTSGNGYSDDEVTFRDVFDTSKEYHATITSDGVGTMTVGGKTYGVTYTGTSGNNDNIVVRLNFPDSSSNGIVLYPTIETSKGAKVALYEPLTINLTNYDGTSTASTGFLLPDGDDYATTAAIAYGSAAAGAGGFVLSGGTVSGAAVNATSNQTVTAGALQYTFTSSAANNQTTVYLLDPSTSTAIGYPALVVFEEEEDRNNNWPAMVVTLEGAGTSSDGLGVNTVRSTTALSSTYTTLESNDDLSQLLSYYGSLVTLDSGESDQKTATISYPDDQVQAKVYVAEGSATTSEGSTGVLGNIVVKDSEVSSVGSKNLIVLGGSCINSVAATLLGSSSPLCGADFSAKTGVNAGSYVIESFASKWSSNNKVALLVAGYNAEDTTNAANALKSNTIDTMTGKKYTGSTATSVTPVLS
jgi:hypothetical protein